MVFFVGAVCVREVNSNLAEQLLERKQTKWQTKLLVLHKAMPVKIWLIIRFSGPGVILEGTFVGVSRHAITDINNKKVRSEQPRNRWRHISDTLDTWNKKNNNCYCYNTVIKRQTCFIFNWRPFCQIYILQCAHKSWIIIIDRGRTLQSTLNYRVPSCIWKICLFWSGK